MDIIGNPVKVIGSFLFPYALFLIPATYLIVLYFLHVCAYYSHLEENISLFDKLKSIIGSMEYYYAGYLIGNGSVIINLVFDTVLFVLLACIIQYVGGKEEEQE